MLLTAGVVRLSVVRLFPDRLLLWPDRVLRLERLARGSGVTAAVSMIGVGGV